MTRTEGTKEGSVKTIPVKIFPFPTFRRIHFVNCIFEILKISIHTKGNTKIFNIAGLTQFVDDFEKAWVRILLVIISFKFS